MCHRNNCDDVPLVYSERRIGICLFTQVAVNNSCSCSVVYDVELHSAKLFVFVSTAVYQIVKEVNVVNGLTFFFVAHYYVAVLGDEVVVTGTVKGWCRKLVFKYVIRNCSDNKAFCFSVLDNRCAESHNGFKALVKFNAVRNVVFTCDEGFCKEKLVFYVCKVFSCVVDTGSVFCCNGYGLKVTDSLSTCNCFFYGIDVVKVNLVKVSCLGLDHAQFVVKNGVEALHVQTLYFLYTVYAVFLEQL